MILFRYLFREVFLSMTAVTAILLVVIMSGRFIKYLSEAAAGELAGEILLQLILFRFPSFLETILPLGLFIGIMLSYGRLYIESEMTVIFSCGISRKMIAVWTMIFAAIVAAVVAALSLYITPYSAYRVQVLLDDPNSSWGLSTLVPGRFQMSEGGNKVSYAQEINSDRTNMDKIFISSRKTKEQGRVVSSVTIAESARVETDPITGKQYLELLNGYIYEGAPGEKKYAVTRFERYGQLLHDEEKDDDDLKVLSDAKPTYQLRESELLVDKAALQWRIALPVVTMMVALLAMVLSETSPRQGRYLKMIPAVLLYLVYLALLIALRGQVEKGNLSPQVGLWPLHGLMLGVVILAAYWKRIAPLFNPVLVPVSRLLEKRGRSQ